MAAAACIWMDRISWYSSPRRRRLSLATWNGIPLLSPKLIVTVTD
uniref:Uncharacterized protein n=1 Tax=Arundo donax TaxID=35708 RepID=A0A0A9CQC9_ARUDO